MARLDDRRLLAAALVAGAILLLSYLALGGASYKPLEVNDPCDARPQTPGLERGVLERLALSALDGAACELRVPREDLALAVADSSARSDFAQRFNLTDDEIEAAARAGLERAINDAEDRGSLSSLEAGLLREVARRVPVNVVIDVLQSSAGQSVLGTIKDLLG